MKYLRVAAKEKTADMFIYGPIGGSFWDDSGITDVEVAEALATLDGADLLKVHIDSPGGDAAQGVAIYNLLTQHPVAVETIVEGWAASAASIILQAGDVRRVAENGLVMIHSAWGLAIGNKVEMRKTADILEKLDGQLALTYARRSGDVERRDDFLAFMEAETWFTGDEALEEGLADDVMRAKAPPEDAAVSTLHAAAIALRPSYAAKYRNMPRDAANDGDVMREIIRMRIALARVS